MSGKIISGFISMLCSLGVLLLLSSCSSTRRLPEGKYLLTKNIIKIERDGIDKDELHGILKQKPNRKILGLFRFHLAVYQVAGDKKETRLRKWLRNTIGEEPVLLDSLQLKKSVRQIRIYMQSKGYFNATVSDSVVRLPGRKKARVYYHIEAYQPYTIRDVAFTIEDPVLRTIVISESETRTLLKPGERYDVDKLQAERKWISSELRNRGYYYFSQDLIYFKVDSTVGNHGVDLFLGMKESERDTPVADLYHPYALGNVYVYPRHKRLQGIADHRDSLWLNNICFVYEGSMEFRPEALERVVFLRPGSLFQEKNVDLTYRRLAALKQFKFINISFTNRQDTTGRRILDAHIRLTPLALQSLTLETEGTHSGGNLGIAGNVVYRHRNAFRGAEMLQLKLKGALEAQKSLTLENDSINADKSPFNTLEFGPELSIVLPKFLFPVKPESISRFFDPRTTLQVGYFFQQRADFTRKIANVSMAYKWNESSTKNHMLAPVDFNFVKVDLDPAARKILEDRNNIFLLNSYRDHLTLGTNYSFIFNSQPGRQGENFTFFRADARIAGNLLRLASYIGSGADTGSGYLLLGVRYAQYFKTHLDFRRYFIVDEASQWVVRLSGGIGYAYGNLKVLPLEESFFGGGANGIRAWKVRSLGPGTYTGTTQFDQTGDIRLETNVEYRFDIIHVLEGAFFADAGNIWLARKDDARPGGVITSRFYEDLAVGSGVGIRFDFTFFVIRLDLGLKMLDPAMPPGERLVAAHVFDKDWKDDYFGKYGQRYPFLNLNLGIGYPF